MGEEKKEEEKTNEGEELNEEEILSEEWDKVEDEEGNKDLAKKEGLPEEKKEESIQAPEKKAGEEEKPNSHGDVDSLTKALNDTKSHSTKVSQENAELRRKVEAFEKGDATAKEVEDQKKKADAANGDLVLAAKAFKEDYPEGGPLFDKLLETIDGLTTEVQTIKKGNKDAEAHNSQEAALLNFNTVVKPEIVKNHPDFDAIMTGKNVDGDVEWFKWAEKQTQGLRFMALESSDPQDISYALTEFKKSKGSGEAERIRAQEETEKNIKLTNGQTLRAGSGSPLLKTKETEGTYSDEWDKIEAEEKAGK